MVDPSGNIIVGGCFNGTEDFDPGTNVDPHTSNGGRDAFISKFDPSGNYLWGKSWGGTEDDRANGLGVDASGNLYVAGCFQGTVDFDPGSVPDIHTSNAGVQNNIYLAKYDSNGNYQWVRTFGGQYGSEGYSCTVDKTGYIYEVGDFEGTANFSTNPDGNDWHSAQMFDAFVSKYTSDGTWIWTRTWGGPWYDDGRTVATDSQGNVYDTGMFQDTTDFDPGPGTDIHTSAGGIDVFINKFDTLGNHVRTRTWGGTGDDCGESIYIDGSDNLFVGGYFSNVVDFNPEGSADIRTSAGGMDPFISKLDTSGNHIWSRTWGGPGDDQGCGDIVDTSGNVYLVGRFQDSFDFDPGTGTDVHTSAGGFDAFMSKFDTNGNYLWGKSWGGSAGDEIAVDVGVDLLGDVFTTGSFVGTVDLDPSVGGIDNHTSNGMADCYLSKFHSDGGW